MKMEENGEEFSAEIKIDVAGQTEEIKVPKHKGGVEVDILNDFNVVRNHLMSVLNYVTTHQSRMHIFF